MDVQLKRLIDKAYEKFGLEQYELIRPFPYKNRLFSVVTLIFFICYVTYILNYVIYMLQLA
ncbi:hypothetical protein SAMN05421676_107147 [Salinibacillus kushneri]|uniref:Uncharacterized protein n=1 Tax=Salinibacillus kushneri TaxID=237682 RepID=A0A1I0GRY1_9BACI|nr:hypothetical protein SAMN05421676_107147 [Salinibacillus kushneri]